ncbi:pyridoxal-phosphate dependent enzyme [Ilumatobacter nonamiensis]|uniref:pyridoxal-phosphate dependent enzyme n=1 Tax=Ilumatobacter nonamiensis TaxID=467093 RepID=UPI0003471DE8|nr:pyridoxal-phosphate dependent enzyme [Ilumatobacter nonamiensis]
MGPANPPSVPATPLPVDLDAIEAIRADVERHALRTPLSRSNALSELIDGDVDLKLETVQPTGSFKIRGAAAKLGSLAPDELERGVITASTGNHGRAVAHVARAMGVEATICLSDNVPAGKVADLERLGCTLDIGGPSQDAAFERAIAASDQDEGPTLVHAFLDPVVVAGQGTCGLEIAEQRPDCGLVLVPLSGGGLISGIAVAVRAMLPDARIIGVSMEHGAAMYESVRAGQPVQLDEAETLADSLQGGVGSENDVTFPIVQQLVDDIVLVSEDELADAMGFALREHRLVVEGAGAVGIAAIRAGRVRPSPATTTVVVCSGANAELATIARLASGEM